MTTSHREVDDVGGVPDLVPVLSRGTHRRPRDGGCFMEFASYLAGEKWSDHPACTHPLLASLARLVNDEMTDHGRARLVPLIPEVVGLHSDDLAVHAVIARRCALAALVMARPDDQRPLAVAVIVAERLLAPLDGRPEDEVGPEATAALDAVGDVAAWARSFTAGEVPRPWAYRREAAPTAVRCAVQAILASEPADPDGALRELLATVIDEVRARTSPPTPPVDHDRWAAACAMVPPEPVG